MEAASAVPSDMVTKNLLKGETVYKNGKMCIPLKAVMELLHLGALSVFG